MRRILDDTDIRHELGNDEAGVMSQKATTEAISESVKELPRSIERISAVEKRVSNLELAIIPSPFVTDDTVAYVKAVPVNALPYAEVNEIGGASRACTNLFNLSSAKFQSINYATASVVGDTLTVTGQAVGVDYYHLRVGAQYTLKVTSTRTGEKGGGICVMQYDSAGTTIAGTYDRMDVPSSSISFTVLDNAYRVRFMFYGSNVTTDRTNSATFTNIMLNEGNTALPYEPYFDGLISAPVTEVKSVGRNLFDETIFFDTSNWVLDTNFSTGNTAAWLELGVFPAGDYVFDADCKRTDLSDVYLYVQTEDIFGTSGMSASVYQNSRPLFERRKLHLDKPTRLRFWTYFGSIGALVTYVSLFESIRIVRGTTEEENIFEPYKSISLPIPEALRNLEGYGLGAGTVGNTIDFDTGKYTRRAGIVDLGTLYWYYDTYGAQKVFSTFDIAAGGKFKEIKTNTANVVCSAPFVSNADVYYGRADNAFCVNNQVIRGIFSEYTDAESFRKAISGVMLVYELAEPIVEDISDLLPLDNYIEVFEGGVVYAENEHKLDVPSTITYQIKEVGNES